MHKDVISQSLCENFSIITVYFIFSLILTAQTSFILTSYSLFVILSRIVIVLYGGSLIFLIVKYIQKRNAEMKIHIESFYIVMIIIFLVFLLLKAMMWPEISCDGLLCHIPQTISFLRGLRNGNVNLLNLHSCYLFPPSCIKDPYYGYPKNYELLLLSFLPPTFSELNAIHIINFLFLLLLISSSYLLFKEITPKSKKLEMVLSVFLLTQPIIYYQVSTAYNDLAITSLFITSLWLIIKSFRHKNYLLPLSISIGLTVGIKYNGLLFSLPSLALLLYFSKNSGFKLLLATIFLFIISGGWWYLYHYSLFGTFLYPLDWSNLKEIGNVKYDYVNSTFQWILYPFIEKEFNYERGLNALSLLFFIFSVCGVIHLLHIFLFKKNLNYLEKKKSILALFIIYLILNFLVFVNQRSPRYFLPLVILCGIFGLSFVKDYMRSPIIFVLTTFLIFDILRFAVMIILPDLLLFPTIWKSDIYQKYEILLPGCGTAFKYVNSHLDNVNLTFITDMLLPLFGNNFQNNVTCIPNISEISIEEQHITPLLDRWNTTHRILKKKGIDYLILTLPGNTKSHFLRNLTPYVIFDNSCYTILKII